LEAALAAGRVTGPRPGERGAGGRILVVAGARPNFPKVAPLLEALRPLPGVDCPLVHTGQHYDHAMSAAFFADLDLPTPDIFLGVGSGSHAEQTARLVTAFEPVVRERRPDVVVVVGDVNSTLACALVAAKCEVPVAHVEAGLRSFDRSMPEEINRVLTDALADYLFTPSKDADENLRREGAPEGRIFRVGNVMVDTLRRYQGAARRRDVAARFGLGREPYAVCTLHRPSNVDDAATLHDILAALAEIQRECPIVFPVHPRTRKQLDAFGLQAGGRLQLVEPLGYLDFLGLLMGAALVLTDSGGVQEETTVLGIPCLTLRAVTERPVTITEGTNVVVGADGPRIVAAARKALAGDWSRGLMPEGWDGHAAERIAAVLTATPPTPAPRQPLHLARP
jgi:UDP-N-acetylglucosamine 2-epimerase (non-hydrolysing)